MAVGIGLGTAGTIWSIREKVYIWIAVAAIVGVAKGIFVIRKSASRTIARLKKLPLPAPIYKMYSGKMWLLVLAMMSVGMAIRIFKVPYEIRGPVYLGIGVALISGCSTYLLELLRN